MIHKADIKKEVISQFENDNRILSVYLLGSALTGTMNKDSDIDLGLLLDNDNSITALERLKLGNNLAYNLGYNVDLGVISSNNLVYASEAIFCGEILYANDLDQSYLKTSTLLGMYLRFNESRQEILDAYKIII